LRAAGHAISGEMDVAACTELEHGDCELGVEGDGALVCRSGGIMLASCLRSSAERILSRWEEKSDLVWEELIVGGALLAIFFLTESSDRVHMIYTQKFGRDAHPYISEFREFLDSSIQAIEGLKRPPRLRDLFAFCKQGVWVLKKRARVFSSLVA
jgi:hypothetical protein